jgi:hypothetical protein
MVGLPLSRNRQGHRRRLRELEIHCESAVMAFRYAVGTEMSEMARPWLFPPRCGPQGVDVEEG